METRQKSIATKNTPIDENFIQKWLECGAPWPTYTKFTHMPLSEYANKREQILEALARTVFIHHNDPDEYTEIVAKLGYEQAAEEFDKRPRDDRTRKANFGEILASEYLRQVKGYDLPVYRLRWNTNPDTSMRGEDVLAFKFGNPDGTEREICVTEAKVMSKYNKNKVLAAHKQLRSGHRPRPNSIPFVYSVLRLKGEREKADVVLTFQKRIAPHPPTRFNFLMIVTGNQPRDPFQVIEIESEVVENLSAANLSLADLNKLVTELFESEVDVDNL